MNTARDRLIVALDVPSVEEARALDRGAWGQRRGLQDRARAVVFRRASRSPASSRARAHACSSTPSCSISGRRWSGRRRRSRATGASVPHRACDRPQDARCGAARPRRRRAQAARGDGAHQSRRRRSRPAGHRAHAGRARAAPGHACARGGLRRRRRFGPRGGGDPQGGWRRIFSSSRRASGPRALPPTTRRGPSARRRPSPRAPIISWSAGPSPARPIPAPRPKPSPRRSRAPQHEALAERGEAGFDQGARGARHRLSRPRASSATCRLGRRSRWRAARRASRR